tara:strand:- start:337337 stop:337978 length:642 start_codon:yes stop_codon:yes gene_type:complete
MDRNKKFWDKIAKRYAKNPVRNMQAYQATLDHTRKYLTRDDKVLEVGCGTGTTALLLAPDVRHITATDLSTVMIDIAQAKLAPVAGENANTVENVHFKTGTLSDQSLDGETYDAVLAFNFLHLVADRPAALGKINTLLQSDGLLISKTICLGEKNILWHILIRAMQAIGIAPYLDFVRYDEIATQITNAGFKIVETGLYPASSNSRFIVARKI